MADYLPAATLKRSMAAPKDREVARGCGAEEPRRGRSHGHGTGKQARDGRLSRNVANLSQNDLIRRRGHISH
jgi:hypothetical protein